jgi:hypothetical protein
MLVLSVRVGFDHARECARTRAADLEGQKHGTVFALFCALGIKTMVFTLFFCTPPSRNTGI